MMLQIPEMSPARKAWATRRLMADQRAKAAVAAAAAIVAPAPKKKPLVESKVVEINLDRADVGSGWRRWIVLEVGEAWVKLFSAASLQSIEVRRAEFNKARPVKFNRAKVIEIIKRNIALADRVNGQMQKAVMSDGGADAVKAMEVMQ